MNEDTNRTAKGPEPCHELKCWPGPFAAMLDGSKTAEFRFDDRGYKVGDLLRLKEWAEGTGYTGRSIDRRVTHITREFGIPPQFVMLSCALLAERGSAAPDSEAGRIAREAADALVRDPNNRFAADVYRHASNVVRQERDVGKTKDKPHGPVSARMMDGFYGAAHSAASQPGAVVEPPEPVGKLRFWWYDSDNPTSEGHLAFTFSPADHSALIAAHKDGDEFPLYAAPVVPSSLPPDPSVQGDLTERAGEAVQRPTLGDRE